MKIALWCCWALLAYTYLGYPGWLKLRTLWRSRPVRKAAITPSISIIVAVRNEEHRLRKKLRNLAMLDYPSDKVEIIVVSDGSTDGTNAVLAGIRQPNLHVIACEQHVGKAEALNRGVAKATGEIVVFTDARQRIEPQALTPLLANFADPSVGCVSGELMLSEQRSSEGVAKSLGLYWRYEKVIRKLESQTGSVVGATGAFYAARRELIPHIPVGTLLDDVFIPVGVTRAGYRVVFEPEARAWDVAATDPKVEFRRKVRTLTGNYQLLRLRPGLLVPEHPLCFRFLSHKMARLLVPFALAGSLISSGLVPSPLYRSFFLIQGLAFAFAALALLVPRLGPLSRLGSIARTFLMLNTAAAVALFNFIRRKEEVWTP